MSADTRKMPEPIIEPATTMVASNSPNRRWNSVSRPCSAGSILATSAMKAPVGDRLRLRSLDEIFDEELHHPRQRNGRVPHVGTDLHVETLAGPLQRPDQLHAVVRVHVVVGRAVVEHQPAFQLVGKDDGAASVVA